MFPRWRTSPPRAPFSDVWVRRSPASRTAHPGGRAEPRQQRSALRAGVHDAGVGARARAASGALGPGAGRLARGLRHRRAAHRPAPQGARQARGRHRDPERLRGGPGGPSQRGADHDRPRHRHRHREPDDGGRAGGRDARCSRTRRASPRSQTSRRCSAPWARGSMGQGRSGSRSRAWRSSAGLGIASSPTASRRARCWWRAAITGGDVTSPVLMPRHLTATLAKLEECGAVITVDGDRVRCRGSERPQAADVITSPLPWLPHGHAGAVHGAARRGRRPFEDHRDHLRESLHARPRALPHGGADRDRRIDGRGAGRAPATRARL